MTETIRANVLKNAAVAYLRSQGLLPASRDGASMRRRWATAEHQAKIAASVERRIADPVALAAMRARMEQNRMAREDVAAAISDARWRKHGWGGFASNEELTKWIIAEHKRGRNARQIALANGMAHNCVCRRLRLAGIELPARGSGRRKIAKSETHLRRYGIEDVAAFDAEVAALYAEGRSVHAIARAYGLNDEPVRTSLYRSAVTLRGKGGGPSKIPPWGYSREKNTTTTMKESTDTADRAQGRGQQRCPTGSRSSIRRAYCTTASCSTRSAEADNRLAAR
jgi:hypothetical protein